MARTVTRVTQTASVSFSYRFTCPYCQHEVNWTEGKVQTSVQAEFRGYVKDNAAYLADRAGLGTKAQKELTDAISNTRDRLEKGKMVGQRVFPVHKCPQCKKVQPWYESSLYTPGIIALLILSIIATFAIMGVRAIPLWVKIPSLFLCVIPITIGESRATKRLQEIRKARPNEGLTVQWPDRFTPDVY